MTFLFIQNIYNYKSAFTKHPGRLKQFRSKHFILRDDLYVGTRKTWDTLTFLIDYVHNM